MKASKNNYIKNKPENYPAEGNNKFENVEVTRQELAEIINNGYAICSQLNGERTTENFKETGFLGLDFDENWTLEEALNDPFIKNYAALVYTTVNHLKDGSTHKFRIIFELKTSISDTQTHKQAISALLKKYPQADQTCSDSIRVFYGSENSNPIILGGYLDVDLLETTTKVLNNSNNDNTCESIDLKPTYDEVKEMLSFIPSELDYAVWRNICFAVANEFGEEGKALIEEWSPDEKDNGKHIDELFKRSDGRVTIGTVLYIASKHGYKIPERLKNLRTSGQVALQDVFDNGKDYATLGDEVYHYDEGCYLEIDSGYFQHQIAMYFNQYPTTDKGKKDFAKASAVKEALNFVKTMTYKNADNINPAGINLKNGYLKLNYDSENNPVFDLIPHSPDNIFTYKADFEYKPDCDPTVIQEALDNIIDSEQQKILLGVLAASLDLQEVRKRRGRNVRLLLLIGEGSNGKDTLKEWISLLYGRHGVTIVPLGAFHAADKGRTFSLYPLITSKVNWSSENEKIKIDNCQNLKTFITGDDMTVEKKFKDPITIKPKAIGLFNLNEDPIFESSIEAVISRYAMMKFENVFKSNPDPDKPWEIPADPKYKEDEAFIKEKILPALLNLMIVRFKEILKEDINYSINDDLIQEIRESVNHLNEFIRELRVIKCDVNQGISPKSLYEDYYIPWCIDNGLIYYKDNDDSQNIIYTDPHKYDKVIRGFRQITPAFKRVIPNLQEKRVPNGNLLGLKVQGRELPPNDLY